MPNCAAHIAHCAEPVSGCRGAQRHEASLVSPSRFRSMPPAAKKYGAPINSTPVTPAHIAENTEQSYGGGINRKDDMKEPNDKLILAILAASLALANALTPVLRETRQILQLLLG